MPSPEQAHGGAEVVDIDDEDESGCCARYCMMCGWVKAACSELCRLFCWPPVPSRIASKLAFVPPLPHYDIRASEPGAGGEVSYTLWLPGDDPNVLSAIRRPTHERDGFTLQVEWLRTSSRNHIPALFFRVERANHTLLFSHGNGTDIGQMFDFFVHLALTLKVSIFAYEYTGYGASSGSMPSERATIEDAEAAWHCVTQKYGVAPGRIVLYGQSVGSGPSCSLAARPEFGAAGLVLHSGMMSGLRVVMPVTRTFPVDPYPNIDLIKHVSCPTAVIHGVVDEVVSFHHGVQMHASIPRAQTYPPLWIKRGSHNNVVGFRSYYEYMKGFLDSLPAAGAAPHSGPCDDRQPPGCCGCSLERRPVLAAAEP